MPAGRTDAIRTVLFDLDGTLADTAPDLSRALNRVLDEQGMPPLPFETVRPCVSRGGRALIELAFSGTGLDTDALHPRFLEIYRDNIAVHTRLFPGIADVLEALRARGINWGVVTNKPAWLTDPLMAALPLPTAPACVISGDTTGNRKPHPEPVLRACERAGSAPAECLYVGDDPRDIEAGREAGATTLVAGFGYLHERDDPRTWGADGIIEAPAGILAWL